MWVDLAREQGNPRHVRLLAESLGVSATADAARLLQRLQGWADAPNGRNTDGLRGSTDPLRGRLRPRMLARAAGWRGEPGVLMAALVQARIVRAAPSGVRLMPRAGTQPIGMGGAQQSAQRSAQQPAALPAPALWQAALAELAALVNRANYDAFLAGTAGLYRSGEWFTVGVPSTYALTALADRFRPALEWVVYVVSGERLSVRLLHAPPTGPMLHLPPLPS